MTHIWRNRLGLAAGALVWCVGVAAHAAAPAPAPADTTLLAHNTGHAHTHGDKPHAHPHKHGDQAHGRHHHPQRASNPKYATPEQHERAAVNDERRRGKGPHNPGIAQGSEFERNALRRCEVFKTREDQDACVARVRSTGTGSVQGGGILREYVQTVPVHP